MSYAFRYMASAFRNMPSAFRFIASAFRYMAYASLIIANNFSKYPNCQKKLAKSLELKSILHKKYCLQQQLQEIARYGFLSEKVIVESMFCLYL